MPSTLQDLLTDQTIGNLAIYRVQESSAFVNVILYGDPGVGKTVLSGSADEVEAMSPTLLIDVEGGTFSLRAFHPDVAIVRVTSWQDMQTIYDELRRGTKYKTVILDSLTEIQKFSMQQIMLDVVKADSSRDPEVPSVREWGKSGEQIRRLVRGFRDLEMNVIFTALVNQDRNPKTGKVTYRPSLPGKLAAEVPGYVDLVLYMYKKEIEGEQHRCLLTAATDEYVCKDRSNNLPPVMIEPTMEEIFNAVHHNIKPAERTFNSETEQEKS